MLGFVVTTWLAVSAQAGVSARSETVGNDGVGVHGALEAALSRFPSGQPGVAAAGYTELTPVLGAHLGEDFSFELGATLRLRMSDAPGARPGPLRPEDWDQTSDFGQLLRQLRLGQEGDALGLWAGPVFRHTLGRGHLVSRYSNQENPDYHPAGADLHVTMDALRLELFASDVLARRLLAAELSADLGRLAGGAPEGYDRNHLSFSVASDAPDPLGRAPGLTVLHLDASAALWRSEGVQLFAFGGLGGRPGALNPGFGALAGLSVDAVPSSLVAFGLKAELRKQGGGFRQGFFGPSYELSRFASFGRGGPALAAERLPDAYSGYGELRARFGEPSATGRETQVGVSAALERFAWGRTDADVALDVRLLDGRLVGSGRWVAVGLGQVPRHLVAAEARYRFAPALYALGNLGTLFFPQADGSLTRGVVAGLGLGVDFEGGG